MSETWSTSTNAVAAFNAQHRARYGHALNVPVEVVNLRCELTAPRDVAPLPELADRAAGSPRTHVTTIEATSVPLYERAELARGQQIAGPALVVETMASTFIDAGWRATVDRWGHLLLAHAAPTSG